MSDQSKHYDYYMVEGESVKALIDGYDAIRESRADILQQAIDKVGAVAHTSSSGWGECEEKLTGFAWDKNYSFPCQVTIKGSDFFDGKPVVIARGKGNTKEGREYNKTLDTVKADTNAKLSGLPSWKSYIINNYGIMRTGIGGPAGRSGYGMAMLSTYGGKAPGRDDCLMFAIPNNKEDDRRGHVEIPADFQKLTYGKWYDIVNQSDE